MKKNMPEIVQRFDRASGLQGKPSVSGDALITARYASHSAISVLESNAYADSLHFCDAPKRTIGDQQKQRLATGYYRAALSRFAWPMQTEWRSETFAAFVIAALVFFTPHWFGAIVVAWSGIVWITTVADDARAERAAAVAREAARPAAIRRARRATGARP